MIRRSAKPRRNHLVAQLPCSISLPGVVRHQTFDSKLRHRRQMKAIQRTAVNTRVLMLRDSSGENVARKRTADKRAFRDCLSKSLTHPQISRVTHSSSEMVSLQLNRCLKFGERTEHNGFLRLDRHINSVRQLIDNDQFQKTACIDVNQESRSAWRLVVVSKTRSAANSFRHSAKLWPADGEIKSRSSRSSSKPLKLSIITPSPQNSSRQRFCSAGSNCSLFSSTCSIGSNLATGFPSRVMMISPSDSRERSASGHFWRTSRTVIVFMRS